MTNTPEGEADAFVEAQVRRDDRDRFLCALFADPHRRPALLALYAFNGEIARIPGSVSEPLLGRIKLQWWRDTLAAICAGKGPPGGHPIAAALARAVESHRLGLEAFEPVIAGREDELETALPDLALLESRAAKVSGGLARLSLAILDVADEPTMGAVQAGATAYGLAARLSAAGEIADQVRDRAAVLIGRAREATRRVDRRALPVLLWTTVAEHRLTPSQRPGPRRAPVMRLAWNAWRGRY